MKSIKYCFRGGEGWLFVLRELVIRWGLIVGLGCFLGIVSCVVFVGRGFG